MPLLRKFTLLEPAHTMHAPRTWSRDQAGPWANLAATLTGLQSLAPQDQYFPANRHELASNYDSLLEMNKREQSFRTCRWISTSRNDDVTRAIAHAILP